MAYIVERYIPGLNRTELLRALERLKTVSAELRREGTPVRYLGSTIVPQDEACFCHFEGPSEAAVAEANRRAGLSFDRIVAAVSVPRTAWQAER
jgi:Nickel responsive protein SCO4226-like